jgi:transcriptional repressor NrdR
MHCPFCQHDDTRVIDSRLNTEANQIRRRRECPKCNHRFNTSESLELDLPFIIKRDGRRVTFDEQKLRGGMLRALEKRPVTLAQVDGLMQRLIQQLHNYAEREIPSRTLGEWVMEELRTLDPVAYVRFASVYRSFEDVEAFRDEIQRLKKLAKQSTIINE